MCLSVLTLWLYRQKSQPLLKKAVRRLRKLSLNLRRVSLPTVSGTIRSWIFGRRPRMKSQRWHLRAWKVSTMGSSTLFTWWWIPGPVVIGNKCVNCVEPVDWWRSLPVKLLSNLFFLRCVRAWMYWSILFPLTVPVRVWQIRRWQRQMRDIWRGSCATLRWTASLCLIQRIWITTKVFGNKPFTRVTRKL